MQVINVGGVTDGGFVWTLVGLLMRLVYGHTRMLLGGWAVAGIEHAGGDRSIFCLGGAEVAPRCGEAEVAG